MNSPSPTSPISPGVLVGGVVAVAVVLMCAIAVPILVTTVNSESTPECITGASKTAGEPRFEGATGGSWLATAYGPPWEGIQGTGVTATGIDLRPAKHAYIVAVDPSAIPLGSYVHVTPNPFNDNSIVFQAADTGGAIIGKHVDVYDWRGRTYQDAWGERKVNVSIVSSGGAPTLLDLLEEEGVNSECASVTSGPAPLTPGETAKILPNGNAAAPSGIPGRAGQIVRGIIAAGNEIDSKPYPEPDVHYGLLNIPWPAYDCSGSTSYALYKAGLHSVNAQDSGELENWGESGPGKYLTIYANSGHVFVSVAGIVFNTAHYAPTAPSGTGPRWQPGWTLEEQLKGDEFGGFVVRHWPGM